MNSPTHRRTRLEAGIITDDLASLERFYVDALGFEVESVREFPEGEVRRLRRDDARLKLYRPADTPTAPTRGPTWHHFAGFAYAALLVDDVATTFVRVLAAGGVGRVEPRSHRPGAVFALVEDPDGNVWELLQESADE